MPPRKRQAAAAAAPATPKAASARQRSQRTGASGKSQYFEPDTDSDEAGSGDVGRAVKRAKVTDVRRKPGSGRKAKKADTDEDDVEKDWDEAEESEYDSDGAADKDEAEIPAAKSNGKAARATKKPARKEITKKPAGKKITKKEEAPGGNDSDAPKKLAGKKVTEQPAGKKISKRQKKEEEPGDDDSDEDGAPRVTFTPFKAMRDTGGVAYVDERLHQNTILFLQDLKENNKRAWLKENDDEYRRSLKDWSSFAETLTSKIAEADETIPELPAKDVIFRIYRDLRFSKDQTPYKDHYAAAWSRTGRKGPYACYYVHCEPGNSFVGGGLWCPDKPKLHLLRTSIVDRPWRWERVLMDDTFRDTFLTMTNEELGKELEMWSSYEPTEYEIVKEAFFHHNRENAMKQCPRDFPFPHLHNELLRLRNFTVRKSVPDTFFTDADGQEKIAEIIRTMVPFITHLNRIVMPDPDASDDDSDDELDE